MSILDDMEQKVTNFINAGTDKARDVSETMRITNEIREEEKKQEQLYKNLGYFYYKSCFENAEGEAKKLCLEIRESQNKIAMNREQLKIIKGIVKCPNCGAEVSNQSMFCNVCGGQLVQKKEKTNNLCSNCGAKIEEGYLFCTSCGSKVSDMKKKEQNVLECSDIERCPNCGKEINPENAFCTSCGTKIEKKKPELKLEQMPLEDRAKRCLNCNAILEEGQKFCIMCGRKVDESGIEMEKNNDVDRCSVCGEKVGIEDMFCINCGTKIER